MVEIERFIVVELPVSTVYSQWTQFESYPAFMPEVRSVQAFGENRLHFTVFTGGVERRWDVDLVAQIPDRKLSWRCVSGPENRGWLLFEPLDADSTRIDVYMVHQLEPGHPFGAQQLDRAVRRVLARFAAFVESRGADSVAWREPLPDGRPLHLPQSPQRRAGSGRP
jgi:uncharacterized membrane protein